ncbi:helix-turn-helix domain-containing protein [Mycolicibacterium psychrotolerans]|uniref:helix-turn-helix domain-containing protein n=1 Tax=Mycolicibacterium psychrotolerans TaxID=216929 RepID=UPI003D66A835
MEDAPPAQRPGLELLTWLDALGVLSAAAATDTDVNQVLTLVADTARKLLGFDFCGVLVPDPSRQRLRIAGWSGLSDDYVHRVNSDHPIQLDSTSPSTKAFHTGTAVAIRDVTAEPEFALWAGIAREQGYRAVIAVPLIAHNEVLGTLNGYYAPVHTFTQHAVQRMMLLANHAAIALTSASRLDELRALNISLLEQRDILRRSEQIHEQLLGVTLRSGGLNGIAATLCELLGRPVLIDDARHAVLAGDDTQFPDAAWRAAADHDDAGSTPVPVRADDAAGQWFVSAVRLGSEIVARIWFPANTSPVSAIDARAVEHGCLVVALEFLRARTADEVEHRLRGELLADLLASRTAPPEDLLLRANRLGHDLTLPHTAMVAALTGANGQSEPHLYERALSQVAKFAAAHHPRPLVAMHAGHIVVLWPPIATADDTPVATAVQRALQLAVPGAEATVAMSSEHRPTYRESYRIAKGTLEIALRDGRIGTVLSVADLGIVGLLLQIDDSATLREFALRTLGPIVDYDAAHRTELVATLRAYLACRRDRTATAAALVIHPNTVAQRLRRIEKLCHQDLDDPAAMMHYTAAITVHDLAGAS